MGQDSSGAVVLLPATPRSNPRDSTAACQDGWGHPSTPPRLARGVAHDAVDACLAKVPAAGEGVKPVCPKRIAGCHPPPRPACQRGSGRLALAGGGRPAEAPLAEAVGGDGEKSSCQRSTRTYLHARVCAGGQASQAHRLALGVCAGCDACMRVGGVAPLCRRAATRWCAQAGRHQEVGLSSRDRRHARTCPAAWQGACATCSDPRGWVGLLALGLAGG